VCYGGLHVNWDLQVFGKRSARVIRIICPLGYGSSDLVYFDFYMFNKIVNYTVCASWSFVFTKPHIQLFYPYPKHSVHTIPSQISQCLLLFIIMPDGITIIMRLCVHDIQSCQGSRLSVEMSEISHWSTLL
jgi:hypothetical protein